MLRDFGHASRTTRRLAAAAAAAALLAVSMSGCGIKGPLKHPDAAPAESAPPAGKPDPAAPRSK
ncbi:hypothetical protein BURK1_02238 [Burkholderiales bacterium]|nr:hypothetical protein BURK1_02238 [Burkholderiales bacterium]